MEYASSCEQYSLVRIAGAVILCDTALAINDDKMRAKRTDSEKAIVILLLSVSVMLSLSGRCRT